MVGYKGHHVRSRVVLGVAIRKTSIGKIVLFLRVGAEFKRVIMRDMGSAVLPHFSYMLSQMKPLFKYMRKEHARLLLNQGKVRIGTLYEFRNLEIHGDIVGDADEGKKSLYLQGRGDTWNSETIPNFAKCFFNPVGPEASITLHGVTLSRTLESPDQYIFCATSEFNEAAMNDFGYDACIRINDPERFFRAISHTIRHAASFQGIFECKYTSRDTPHDEDNGIPPALIKDPKYELQKEVRGLWQPPRLPIKPRVIKNRKFASCCSAQHGL